MTDEKLAGGWTRDRLAQLPPLDRNEVWRKAKALKTEDGDKLAKAIEEIGLWRDRGGLTADHPTVVEMREVIASPEGRRGMETAVGRGEPGLAGVEPLISASLGSEHEHPDATSWAGTLVALELESMGYVRTSAKPMPAGSIAKTAMCFALRK